MSIYESAPVRRRGKPRSGGGRWGVAIALAAAGVSLGCSRGDGWYGCGPVGASLFCTRDQACVVVASFSGARPEVWACAPDVGCAPDAGSVGDGSVRDDAVVRDYCGPETERARCERVVADATDGSRPMVSVVECTIP